MAILKTQKQQENKAAVSLTLLHEVTLIFSYKEVLEGPESHKGGPHNQPTQPSRKPFF